jgi:hypothetical protein
MAKKGSTSRSSAKSAKAGTKRTLRDLAIANDKSRNIKGGATKKKLI